MLSLNLEEFMIELKDGSVKNVGPPTKSATAKLYDVESAEAREFGDERVKISCTDGAENTIEVALSPAAAEKIREEIQSLEADSRVFE